MIRYGDGVGLYRTHLFGSPAIIACTPAANNFVLQTESSFFLEWPSVELVGTTSLVAVQGSSHTRVRSFVMRAINQPDALHKIALRVQPRITVALESWAQKGRIRVYKEAKKVTFANIGKYFASLEPGLVLDTLDELFECLTAGLRAYPLNFPGTAFHRALQMLNFLPKAEGQGALWVGPTQDRLRLCRKKAIAIFRDEMEKRKKCDTSKGKNDLMEGLMQMKDDDGEQLTETEEEHMPMTKKLNGEFITYDNISSCEYTGKVVEEIRLANVAAFIFRTAKTDVEYKGSSIFIVMETIGKVVENHKKAHETSYRQ
ncbi:UNVERIFIED_CONTAM: Ent-kaurenoic acid oxidase 1 [Sesamum radiatum]|uniref:Ent-kaurenoic acid oxidase 1 n=1 Tax=Sesamum radiatum TaxID=300843 RepID=A0AAW2K644_SESRA